LVAKLDLALADQHDAGTRRVENRLLLFHGAGQLGGAGGNLLFQAATVVVQFLLGLLLRRDVVPNHVQDLVAALLDNSQQHFGGEGCAIGAEVFPFEALAAFGKRSSDHLDDPIGGKLPVGLALRRDVDRRAADQLLRPVKAQHGQRGLVDGDEATVFNQRDGLAGFLEQAAKAFLAVLQPVFRRAPLDDTGQAFGHGVDQAAFLRQERTFIPRRPLFQVGHCDAAAQGVADPDIGALLRDGAGDVAGGVDLSIQIDAGDGDLRVAPARRQEFRHWAQHVRQRLFQVFAGTEHAMQAVLLLDALIHGDLGGMQILVEGVEFPCHACNFLRPGKRGTGIRVALANGARGGAEGQHRTLDAARDGQRQHDQQHNGEHRGD